MDNEWKSDLAMVVPLTVCTVAMNIVFTMVAYMKGNVEIERLRLAQMQYQSEFVTHEIAEGK